MELERYTVYDARTGLPVIICGTSTECANAIGVTPASFRCFMTPSGLRREKRWEIHREGKCVEYMPAKTYGENMRACRVERGYTRKILAERSGVSEDSIRSYEADVRLPNLFTAILMADALGVSLDKLIGRKVK